MAGLEDMLKKKEKLLTLNKEYQRLENIYHKKASGTYLGDFIFGASDGLVTTFAVISGAFGASFSSIVIIIMGIANLIGDGFSMGLGNFLGKKSEIYYAKKQREKETYLIGKILNFVINK